ncbi:MAG: copper-binding protein [Motiliproteus sp.]
MKIKRVAVTLTQIVALISALLFSSFSTADESPVQVNGVVESVMLSKQMLKVSHDAVPAWGWMKMKMKFLVSADIDLKTISKGQKVEMTMVKGSDGKATITAIK